MRTYQATPSTSIPHESYQCDGYGNTLYRGNDAMRVARIESQISMVDVDPSDPDFREFWATHCGMSIRTGLIWTIRWDTRAFS